MFRQSCGVCKYCNTTRPSDITIADFWGWEKTNPTFNIDDKGVSLILVNTERGQEIFEAIKNRMNYFPANLEDCLQTHLRKPSDVHKKRDQFEKEYINLGFDYVINKYRERFHLRKVFCKVRKRTKKYIRLIIRKTFRI